MNTFFGNEVVGGRTGLDEFDLLEETFLTKDPLFIGELFSEPKFDETLNLSEDLPFEYPVQNWNEELPFFLKAENGQPPLHLHPPSFKEPPLIAQHNTPTESRNNKLKLLSENDMHFELMGNVKIQTRKTKQPDLVQKTRCRWLIEEQKLFIEGLAKFGRDYKKIQVHIKTKNITQVRSHAQKYFLKLKRKEQQLQNMSIVPPTETPVVSSNHLPSHNTPWTETEISLFQEGLDIYGSGKWKQISAHIKTRSSLQVKNHARKYFEKLRRNRTLEEFNPTLQPQVHSTIDSENDDFSLAFGNLFNQNTNLTLEQTTGTFFNL